jgi:hypothetical protein
MMQGQNMPDEFYDAKRSPNDEPDIVLPPLSPVSQRFWSLPHFDRERIVQRLNLGRRPKSLCCLHLLLLLQILENLLHPQRPSRLVCIGYALYSNLSVTDIAILYERFGPPDTAAANADANGTICVFDQLSDSRRPLGMLAIERCLPSISLCSALAEGKRTGAVSLSGLTTDFASSDIQPSSGIQPSSDPVSPELKPAPSARSGGAVTGII